MLRSKWQDESGGAERAMEQKDIVKLNELLVSVYDDIEEIDFEEIGSYKLPGEAKYVGGVSWYVQDEQGTTDLIRNVFLPRTKEEWIAQQNMMSVVQ